MKKTAFRLNFLLLASFALGPFVLLLLMALSGCASPLASKALFQVTTNYVPQVHVIEHVVTNTVIQTNVVQWSITNTVAGVPTVTERTNVVLVPVERTVTNTITVTNQVPVSVEVLPREVITSGVAITGGMAGPWGTFAAVAITGLLGVWARARQRKINAQLAGQVQHQTDAAVVLAESIEVAREILKNTPQGQQTEAAYLNWLKGHQRTAGVVATVTDLVDKHVDNQAARQVAQLLRPPA